MIGLWVWKARDVIPHDANREQLVRFIKNNQIGKVYLWVDESIPHFYYKEFIRAAGVHVYALKGDASYVLPAHREKVVQLVQWVDTFNRENAPYQFTGIQLDIEPYQYPEWKDGTKEAELAQQWAETMELFASSIRLINPGLKTSAALPFWADTILVYGYSLFDRLLLDLDEAVLMSYRDTAEKVLSISKSKLDVGDRFGKKVLLGFETKKIDPPHITFHEEGRQYMENELSRLLRMVQHESFGGVVIHDYEGMANLTEGPRPVLTGPVLP